MSKLTRQAILMGGTAIFFTLIGIGLHSSIAEYSSKAPQLEACRDSLESLKAYKKVDSLFHDMDRIKKEKVKGDE